MSSKLPSIPSIPSNIDAQLFQVLSAVKTQLDYAQENPSSSSTTNAVDQAQLEAAVANAVSGITKGDTGAPGSPGTNGSNGKSYVLDIIGGRTSLIYDASGSNPLPSMTAFSAELYEDGVLVTPSSYSWFISDPSNSLLSGTGSSATFTPTVSGTFDQAKGNNSVVLVASYAGLSIRATEPISISKIGATGATGATGPQGTAGTPGAAGTNSYFHVAYADSADGSTNFNQVSGTYIGTYVDSNPTDSSSPSAYQWVLIKGAQGPQGNQGIPGTNGTDGTTSYLHIKYSDDGGATFTASSGEAVGKYIGTYVDTNPVDSTSVLSYTWALIKGADGTNGKTYLLFITGGKTNAVYDSTGANPLPAPTAFSAELYEDGALVTPATYSWSVPGSNTLLSGSSSSSTFTPSLATNFDINKGDNRVLLTCTYAGQTVKAVQPIAITQQVSGSTPDTSTPAAIDDLLVTGGVLYNFLTWGVVPGITDHVDVYRAATDDRTVATVVGSTKSNVYSDYLPSGVGNTYYYWIRAISKTGVTGDWNLVSGLISSSGTAAIPLGIGDSQVSTISATKIVAATLAAISANLGTVTAGTIQSTDSTFIIDLSSKSITVAGPAGLTTDDYTILQNGQLQFWKWTGATHQQGQSLQTIESGTASNGSTVTLSKWYPAIPSIVVTPSDTPIYNATYSNQSQKLQVRAEGISRTSGGVVSFTAVSRLVLSGANPSTPVNEAYSGSSDTWTSTPVVTAANTTQIDVSVQFSSQRGTGTVPNYYYRKVQARIGWRVNGSGGAYTYSSYVTTNMGADFNTYSASLSSGTIASGTWQFIVEYVASDLGGTFASGSATYDYLQNDVYLAANTSLFSQTGGGTTNAGFTNPAFTPASGYSVYQVDWTVSYGKYLFVPSNGNIAYTWNAITNSSIYAQSVPGSQGTNGVPAATDSMTYTKGSYSQSQTPLQCYVAGSGTTNSQIKIFAAGTFARIYTRKLQANSATPANMFKLVSYSLTLSSATVIDSTGTLNWMAIG